MKGFKFYLFIISFAFSLLITIAFEKIYALNKNQGYALLFLLTLAFFSSVYIHNNSQNKNLLLKVNFMFIKIFLYTLLYSTLILIKPYLGNAFELIRNEELNLFPLGFTFLTAFIIDYVIPIYKK